MKHTYVDDPTSGSNTTEEAIQLIAQINEILGEVGFTTLRKWSSSSTELLGSLSDTINTLMPIQFPTVKALGIHWLATEDVFTFIERAYAN